MLKTVFFSLSLQLAVGQLLIPTFISRETIGNLFYRVVSLVSLILLGLAVLAEPYADLSLGDLLKGSGIMGSHQAAALGLAVLSLVVLLANQILFPRLNRATLLAAFGLGLAAVVFDSLTYPEFQPTRSVDMALAGLNGVTSAMMLGGVLAAMITGHWYLVTSKLSIRPLKIASAIFIAAVAIKTLLLALTLASYWTGPNEALAQLARSFISLAPESIFFWARFSFGILAPLFFSFLIWGTVKIRSTQSATGILYATLILVLLGEAFGKFLFYFSGIPS
jgi:hypothetical protein